MSKYSLAKSNDCDISYQIYDVCLPVTMLCTDNSILTSYSHYQLDMTVYALEKSNMIMFCACVYVVPFVVSLSMIYDTVKKRKLLGGGSCGFVQLKLIAIPHIISHKLILHYNTAVP